MTREEKLALAARIRLGEDCDPPVLKPTEPYLKVCNGCYYITPILGPNGEEYDIEYISDYDYIYALGHRLPGEYLCSLNGHTPLAKKESILWRLEM